MNNIYDILRANFSAISDIAAIVGVDWAAHADSITLPIQLKAAETKSLDKSHKKKCGIIAEIRVVERGKHKGKEYPFLVFSTFKEGHHSETWSGYSALDGHDCAQYSDQEIRARKAKREQAQREKEALEAKEAARKRESSLTDWDSMPVLSNTNVESEYLKKKHLLDYSDVFRVGSDLHGDFIAHPLYDNKDKQVGFERIYSDRKMISQGCRDLYFGFVAGDTANPFEKVYITEGYADAISVSKATGCDCFASISAGNIPKLVKHLSSQQQYSNTKIIIAADNDAAGLNNKILSIDVDSYTVVTPTELKDYNDVLVAGGVELVREQLNNIVLSKENARYLSLSPVAGSINLLIAEKGVGKTTAIRKFIEEQNEDASILVVTHRRTLNRTLANDLNLFFYEDIKDFDGCKALTDQKRLATSPESLRFINPSNKYDVVIIDEAEQVLDHSSHSETMNTLQCHNTARLIALCCNCKTLILSDANLGLASREMATFAQEESGRAISTLINSYRPRKARNDKITITHRKNDVYEQFKELTSLNIKTFVATDSIAEAKAIYEFAECGSETLLLNSETAQQYAIEMENPDSLMAKYKHVIYTPTMGTGVSINAGHGFERGLFIFTGRSITAEECSQMLARFRDFGDYYGFIGEYRSNVPTEQSVILSTLLEQPAVRTLSNVYVVRGGGIWIDDFARVWSACEGNRNRSKEDFKAHLLSIMEQEGFDIHILEEVDKNEMTTSEKKSQSSINSQINDIKQSNTSKNIELKAEELRETYNINEDLSTDLAIADKRIKLLSRGVNNISLAQMTYNEASMIDFVEMTNHSCRTLSLVELTHAIEKRKVLKSIYRLIGVNHNDFTLNKKIVWTSSNKTLVKKIEQLSEQVYSLFRVKLNQSDPIKALNQLCAITGVRTVSQQGTSARQYMIDTDSLRLLKIAVELVKANI